MTCNMIIIVFIIVLTLTPNTTTVTVEEGDYAVVCVSTDQVQPERDTPSFFYALYDDKAYSADSM